MAKKELKSEHFFRLYNAAQKRIYAYLLIMVHNHSDAEDLHQETASVLWERFDEFDKSKSFTAWAIGIARNKALDYLFLMSRKEIDEKATNSENGEKLWTLSENLLANLGVMLVPL